MQFSSAILDFYLFYVGSANRQAEPEQVKVKKEPEEEV